MRAITLTIILLLTLTPALAEQVVINSEDWRDVYSGLQYASITGQKAFFVLNAEQGAALPQRLSADPEILLITGREQGMPGFKALIQSQGFTITEEITSRNPIDTNHELARKTNNDNLVIISDSYAYNAISVGTYARMRNSSVVFARPDVIDLIQEKNGEEVLLFGQIPSSTYEEIVDESTIIINNQDKFEDNFELAKRYISIQPSESLLMSNGEFIETQLIQGSSPIIFTGRENVPEEVLTFISNNDFRVAILIGNALAPNAKYIKDKTGISIFIKFAQGRDQEQFALDLFPVPIINPEVIIGEVTYDLTTRTLRITYQNPGEIATYLRATIQGPEGDIEDTASVFLDAGTYKTITYEMGEPGEEISYLLLYGPSPTTLEYIEQGSAPVSKETIDDSTDILVGEVVYDTSKEGFYVTIQNIGGDSAFVRIEAKNVRVGGDYIRVASEVVEIAPGAEEKIFIPLVFTDQDIKRNSEVELEIFYGAREFSLVHTEQVTKSFSVTQGLPFLYIGIALVVALLLIFFVVRKKKKR